MLRVLLFSCAILVSASEDVTQVADNPSTQLRDQSSQETQPNSISDVYFSHDKFKPDLHKPFDHKPFIHKPHIPIHHISIPIPIPDLSYLIQLIKPLFDHKPYHHYENHHNKPHHHEEHGGYGPYYSFEYDTHKHQSCHCPPPRKCHHKHDTATHKPTEIPTHTTEQPKETTTHHHVDKTKKPYHYIPTVKPELYYHVPHRNGATYPRDPNLNTFLRQLFWPFNPLQQGQENVIDESRDIPSQPADKTEEELDLEARPENKIKSENAEAETLSSE